MIVRAYREEDEAPCRALFNAVGLDVLAYVRLQLDLEPRDRRPGERLGDRDFRV